MNGSGVSVLIAVTVHPITLAHQDEETQQLESGFSLIYLWLPTRIACAFSSIKEPNQCSDRGSKEVTTYVDEAWNHIHPFKKCLKKALVSFIPCRTDRYERKVLYWAETAVKSSQKNLSHYSDCHFLARIFFSAASHIMYIITVCE